MKYEITEDTKKLVSVHNEALPTDTSVYSKVFQLKGK